MVFSDAILSLSIMFSRYVHVIAYINISFLFMAELYVYTTFVYHYPFIC